MGESIIPLLGAGLGGFQHGMSGGKGGKQGGKQGGGGMLPQLMQQLMQQQGGQGGGMPGQQPGGQPGGMPPGQPGMMQPMQGGGQVPSSNSMYNPQSGQFTGQKGTDWLKQNAQKPPVQAGQSGPSGKMPGQPPGQMGATPPQMLKPPSPKPPPPSPGGLPPLSQGRSMGQSPVAGGGPPTPQPPGSQNLSTPQFDPRNLASKLQPGFADKLQDTQQDLSEDRGVQTTIGSGYRSPQEQARLYAQGRTAPGPRVTNAPPGGSEHNKGLAADLVPGKGQQGKGTEQAVGSAAKNLGLGWGGDFSKLYDPYHVQQKPTQNMRGSGPQASASKVDHQGIWEEASAAIAKGAPHDKVMQRMAMLLSGQSGGAPKDYGGSDKDVNAMMGRDDATTAAISSKIKDPGRTGGGKPTTNRLPPRPVPDQRWWTQTG